VLAAIAVTTVGFGTGSAPSSLADEVQPAFPEYFSGLTTSARPSRFMTSGKPLLRKSFSQITNFACVVSCSSFEYRFGGNATMIRLFGLSFFTAWTAGTISESAVTKIAVS